MKRVLLGFVVCTVGALCQKPVISPGGVVSAASYTAGIFDLTRYGYPQTGGGPVLGGGSIASIFGSNLAISPRVADGSSLPFELGGTSVSVNGVAAPLFFVSPTQINFQVPTSGTSIAAIIVSTAAGQSDPYQLTTGAGLAAPGSSPLTPAAAGRQPC
jgi:hypothetical protein